MTSPGYPYPYPPQPEPTRKANVPGNIGFALALVGFLLAFSGPAAFFGAPVGIAGLVLGIVGVTLKHRSKVLSIIAIVLAVLGGPVSIVSFSIWAATTSDSVPNQQPRQPEAAPAPEEAEPEAQAPDLSTYSEIGERDLGFLIRDPEAHVGQSFIAYAEVEQFDAVTGNCMIRVSMSHTQREYAFEYDHNAAVEAPSATCGQLEQVLQSDIVKLWVTAEGVEQFETRFGNGATVPVFRLDQLELLPPAA